MSIVINGDGSISGISVGGLPDGTVDAGTLATNSVDLSDRTFRNAWTYTAGSDEKTSADLSDEDLAKYNMKENL